MVVNDIHEEEQEFIVSKQQDDMDSATIPTPITHLKRGASFYP